MKKNGFLLLVSKMKKNGFLLIEIMIFLGVMSIFFITISQYFTTLLITYENSNKKIEAFNKASKILNSLLQNYDDSVNSKDTIISEVSSGIKLPAIFVNNNKKKTFKPIKITTKWVDTNGNEKEIQLVSACVV